MISIDGTSPDQAAPPVPPGRWIHWIGALVLGILLVGSAHAGSVRNVLVLHSYHQGLQWTDSISGGIQAGLQAGGTEFEIHYEYLDTKRNPGESYFQYLVQFESYKTKLTNIDFELIIASDNNALRFMVDHGDLLFPGVPVVFCGVNNYHPDLLKGHRHITGVVEAIDYRATLDLMRRLHPERRNVLVILDRTPTGNAIKVEFAQMAVDAFPDLKFEFYQDFVLAEVPQKISSLGDDDMIYMLTFNRDRNDNFISYVDGIRMVRSASRVPIYGSWEFYFGNGIVGGMITSGYIQGQQAARLAMQVLNGIPVTKIPVVARSPNRFMFDHTEIRRFGIKIADLPEGSKIINRPPGLAQRYKGPVLGVMLLLSGTALILGWRLSIQQRQADALRRNNLELDRRVAEQTRELKSKNTRLETEINERQRVQEALLDKTRHLETALSRVKTLSGLLPICANCKKIRDDKGYWNQIESYIDAHSDATFTHGICPQCSRRLYPDLFPDASD